jgi:hypothetical protein
MCMQLDLIRQRRAIKKNTHTHTHMYRICIHTDTFLFMCMQLDLIRQRRAMKVLEKQAERLVENVIRLAACVHVCMYTYARVYYYMYVCVCIRTHVSA